MDDVGEAVMETLTHTKRRDFQNCRRYFLHRHVHRLAPRMQKGGRRRGSAFGDAIFACLETARAGGDTEKVYSALVWSLNLSYDQIIPQDQEEADALELERAKIHEVVVGYIRRYGLATRREIEYDLPLINPRTRRQSRSFRLGGKIDGLEPLGRSRVRIVEDKLVGQIQEAMIARLPLDQQSTEYVDAVLARGWDAEVAYRHTLLPQSKPKLIGTGQAKRRETMGEYRLRLREDIAARPEHYFDEQILQFPREHLEEYRRERWGIGQQILEARREVGRITEPEAFPKNPSRCWEFGGCEYIPLCTMRSGAMDLYTTVPDNPELTGGSEGATTEYGPEA